MQLITIFLSALFTLAFITCKKNTQANSKAKEIQINSSSYISWKACSQTTYKNDEVKICFDSLLQDSRCLNEVLCVWQGIAVVKFSFFVNNNEHNIVLSPQNSPPLYPSDTSLMGYKIVFLSLKPYPQIGVKSNVTDYKAEMMITKL